MDNDRNKKRKKMISLRNQIRGICVCFSLLIGAAWFVMLFAGISSYQGKQDEKRLALLAEHAEVLDDSIIQLNQVTGDIFESNESFTGLSQYRNASEEVDYIFSLLNILKIQINSNKNLSGLFFFYDNMKKVQYAVNENMDFRTKEELKKAGIAVGLSSSLANKKYGSTTYVKAAEEETYYNVMYKRAGVMITGCVSLEAGLPLELEQNAVYGVVYRGAFYPLSGEMAEMEVSAEELLPGKNQIHGSTAYVQKLNVTDMAVVEILPDNLWMYMNPIHIFMGVLGVFFVFLAIGLNRLVAFELLQPLADMNNALSNIQAGEWQVHFEAENRVEEIENMRRAVEMLLEEIEQYKIRSYEEQLEKQETELQYLQLQLAPHFYTNCLKNAYYMLMLKEYENVGKYLLCLSVHLRYLLQKNVKLVSLYKERDFVANYIELQKQMTEKKLELDMMIHEDALDVEVPVLFLQTFVENSIKYGRETGKDVLKIQICIRRRQMECGECLDVTIRDNGIGYPEDILCELNQGECSQEQKFGVGIINLQHCMKIYYGEQVSWYFYNASGACSDLIIPVNGGRTNECITCG